MRARKHKNKGKINVTQDIYTFTRDVESFQMDYAGRVSAHMLVALFMEAAVRHANQLGQGYRDLYPQGKLWLLTRTRLLQHKELRGGDEMAVHTWISDPVTVVYPRSYQIYNQRGELCAEGISSWVVVDTISHKIKKPEQTAGGRPPLLPLPGRLPPCPETTDECLITPQYCDFDINRHVNNGRYIEWVLNRFPPQWHEENLIRELQINYQNEAMGEPVRLFTAINGKGALFYGQTDKPCFEALVKW